MLPRLIITPSEKDRKQYEKDVMKEMNIGPFHFFSIEPVDGTISIDQLRAITPLFMTKTDTLRLLCIHSFELAPPEAQNFLLKLLEEKTGMTLFLIFVGYAEGALPTIRSRTQIIKLGQPGRPKDESAFTRLLLELKTKNISAILNDQANAVKSKEDALDKIDGMITSFQKILITSHDEAAVQILKKALTIRNDVLFNNANPQFAYDNLLIFVSEVVSMIKKA